MEPTPSAAMELVLVHIREQLHTRITVEQLARLAMMSEGHFSRRFKALTACSPIEYILRARIEKAAALLAHTDEKLIAVAVGTGFRSLGYFIRVFTARRGCSPSEYRRRARSQSADESP